MAPQPSNPTYGYATIDINQAITLCAGATYKFSAWSKRSSTACTAQYWINRPAQTGFTAIKVTDAPVGQYVLSEVTFTVPGDYTGSLVPYSDLKFAVGFNCPNGPRGLTTVAIDDVQFVLQR